jgi:hypothetical protein
MPERMTAGSATVAKKASTHGSNVELKEVEEE